MAEKVGEQQVAYVWCCTRCDYYFETRDEGVGHEPSAKSFYRKLVVE